MSYLKLFHKFYPGLVKSMSECSHHYSDTDLNEYHIEGCLWSHTCLVAKELEGTDLEKAAILHDIGKIQTRVEDHEKKLVRFTGHENMSAFMSLSIFKDWKLPQEERQRLFELIAMHGLIGRLDTKNLELRLTNKPILAGDLYRFATADHRGRFYENPENMRKIMFTLAADKPLQEPKDKEVTFLIGLPGSGKTTLAQTLTGEVVDELNLTYQERAHNLVKYTEYKKKAIVLLPDLLTLVDRLEKRGDSGEQLKQLIMDFDVPDYQEFEEIEWRFK